MSPRDELLADLAAEQGDLLAVLDGLGEDDWFRATPAKGWDVRDTIAHLADTDELAIDTMLGGPRSIQRFVAELASAEDLTLWGVFHGRRHTGPEVAAWWADAQQRERAVLADLADDARVPWGLGMGVPAFMTARLMETWAHSLDVRHGLGVAATDTDRLRHVAWISVRALPYAASVAGIEAPGPIRVELDLPSGDSWSYGPEDAANRITGSAGEFCRVFVQRLTPDEATALHGEGDDARLALEIARAYL